MPWTIFEIQKLPDVLFLINLISWKIAWLLGYCPSKLKIYVRHKLVFSGIIWAKSNNQSFLLLATKNSAMKPEFYKINANSKKHLFSGFVFPYLVSKL